MFHQAALTDADDAAAYYSGRVPQLGEAFIAELMRIQWRPNVVETKRRKLLIFLQSVRF